VLDKVGVLAIGVLEAAPFCFCFCFCLGFGCVLELNPDGANGTFRSINIVEERKVNKSSEPQKRLIT
jgi:hypothetical protein